MDNNSMAEQNAEMEKMFEFLSSELYCAYVYQGSDCTECLVKKEPEELANFIGARPDVDRIEITDCFDTPIISTIGYFLDRCFDPELREKVLEALVPIQKGEREAKPVMSPTMEEAEKFSDLMEKAEDELGLEFGGI